VASSVGIGELAIPMEQLKTIGKLEINTELFTKRPAEKRTKNIVKVSIPLEIEEKGFSLREKQEMKTGDLFKAVIMNKKTQEIFVESNILQVEE